MLQKDFEILTERLKLVVEEFLNAKPEEGYAKLIGCLQKIESYSKSAKEEFLKESGCLNNFF